MYNLQDILVECKKELNALGIKYEQNIVIKQNSKFRYLGLTTIYNDDRPCLIEISSTLLDERNPKSALKETVMHELLHTCKNANGHTGVWKSYANLVNKTYGYHISRTNSLESLGVVKDDRPFKHKLICKKCGTVFYRQKECKLTKHPEFYQCKCGGEIKKIF